MPQAQRRGPRRQACAEIRTEGEQARWHQAGQADRDRMLRPLPETIDRDRERRQPGATGVVAGGAPRSGAAGARVVGWQARRVTVGLRCAERLRTKSLALLGVLLHSGGKETNA